MTSKGKILVTGGTGFIGSHVTAALSLSGYGVVGTSRSTQRLDGFPLVQIDFRAVTEELWFEKLDGFDLVINSVGIISETKTQSFTQLHTRAPEALFAACAAKGIKVIQISALGADELAMTQYHLSKKAADDFLIKLNIPSAIIYPSLVYGGKGQSSRLFRSIASLPFIIVPGQGDQLLQPIHIGIYFLMVSKFS